MHNINNNKLFSELYALIFVLLKQKCKTMKTLYSDTVAKIIQSAKNVAKTVPIRTRRNAVNILVYLIVNSCPLSSKFYEDFEAIFY